MEPGRLILKLSNNLEWDERGVSIYRQSTKNKIVEHKFVKPRQNDRNMPTQRFGNFSLTPLLTVFLEGNDKILIKVFFDLQSALLM